MINKKILPIIFLLFSIFSFYSVSAYMTSQTQYTQYTPTTTPQEFDQSICTQGQDFLIQISPFGCTPAVVRSDLLEENDVPIYCQLGATKINPLIDVNVIDSISFTGNYPKEVAGVGFHPVKAALGVQEDLNTPILDNIGYLVILLKKQANESAMPDFVEGTLSAKIKYNINNAFGIGSALFYLPELNDQDWQAKKSQLSFWNGRGYLRADAVNSNNAEISVYSGDQRISSVTLKKGETSNSVYLPGFECQAGLKLQLTDLVNPSTMAELRVNADAIEVIQGESFLNNKCTANDVSKKGLTQQVTIRCQEDTGVTTSTLSISPRVIVNINGENKEVGLGDKLFDTAEFDPNVKSKSVYLGYIGETKSGQQFIVPVVSPAGDANEFKKSFIFQQLPNFINIFNSAQKGTVLQVFLDIAGAGTILTNSIASGSYPLGLYAKGAGRIDTEFDIVTAFHPNVAMITPPISFIDFANAQDVEITGDAKTYYDNAKADYESLRNSFASQPYTKGMSTTFGEEALYNEIVLANDAGQKKTASDLCKEFKQDYPNSKIVIPECSNALILSNQDSSSIYVNVNKQTQKISFDGIYEPTLDDYGVYISIENAGKYSGVIGMQKNQRIQVSDNETISLIGIGVDTLAGENSATFDVSSVDGGTILYTAGSATIKLNDYAFIGKNRYKITLTKINLKKFAKVSVIPNIDNTGTEANFSFKIGIEKRAINLPPEKVRQIIGDLDKSINQWQSISNSLGGVVETLKTGCLVTGATLIAKNFLTNTGSTGIARQSVMTGANGWSQRCADLVSKKTYATQDECYSKNADKIDADVAELSKTISNQNSNIKNLEQGITTQQFLTENVVNTSAFMQKYTPQVNSYLQQNLPNTITDPKGVGESLNKSDLLTVLSYSGWSSNIFSTEQLRNVELYAETLNDPNASPELKQTASAELYSNLLAIKTNSKNYAQISTLANNLKIDPNRISSLEIDKNVKKIQYEGLTNGNLGSRQIPDFSSDTPIAIVQTFPDGKQYILVLDNSKGTSQMPIKTLSTTPPSLAVYDSTGTHVQNPPKDLVNIYFQKYDSTSYKNQYKNAKLRYYETDPYKGLPAIVPFDLQNGWYAAMKQTLPVGGAQATYQASGRVNSFYLCNVGANGLEEFQTVGDDICEMINTGTGQPYNQFAGLSETDARNLVTKAIQAIEQASKLYKPGLSGKVKILNEVVDVGSPATDVPQFECQDFMSPNDCKLLFNICDPVICPSSRCDLGGAYPVKDVVQTGIIGSLVLCLPNAREGIILPVCLTGVKAGIDGFLSVQKAYKDCLRQSLDTGKMVGICDEIYSLYMCDFFWRQSLPVAGLVIPKVIEFLSGQNVRGGGEYLSVASSWSTAQQAINYFINSYGANSKAAFLARSSQDVGTEFCKVFTSAVVPSGSQLLDTLTKPDSPVQFTGRFDEISLTSVTNPPTSQYKVYYHIYAGQDTGTYYQVYLKGSPESSYYRDTAQNVLVDSGYIPVGGYVDKSPDLIANSGYAQLCINVNGQEECGFKEVSTSFAVNYVKDQVVSSQATQSIKTTNDCISGYGNGIIRICATDNPGKTTDPYVGTNNSRWQDVGYCDNDKIRCWIDTQSIENSIKTTTVENATLSQISTDYFNQLANNSNYLTRDQFSSAIQDINTQNDTSKVINYINNIFDKIFWTDEKAQLLLIRGNAYSSLFKILWAQMPRLPTATTSTMTTCNPSSILKSVSGVVPGLFGLYDVFCDSADGISWDCGASVPNPIKLCSNYSERIISLGYNCDSKGAICTSLSSTQTSSTGSASGNAIWASAESLVNSGWNEHRTSTNCQGAYSCIYGNVCARFVLHSIINAGVGSFLNDKNDLTKGCSQDVCNIANGKMTFNENSWSGYEGIDNLVPKMLNSGDFVEISKDNLVKGDIVILGCQNIAGLECANGRHDNQHATIFDSYSSDGKSVNVYGDPGQTSNTALQSFSKSLSGNSGWYVFRAFRYTSSFVGSAGQISTNTGVTSPTTQSIGEKIYNEAVKFSGSSQNSAQFVSQSLVNAGISGISVVSSFDSFVSTIGSNNNFVEVNVNFDTIQEGDVILLGQGCTKNIAGIYFYSSPQENKNIYFYSNIHGQVKLESTQFSSEFQNGLYIYKVYRYTGGTSPSDKVQRTKWNLDSAITQVSALTGDYTQNKVFVDQLIFDGVLTQTECQSMTGTGGGIFGFLTNTQGDMTDLRKILLAKKVSPGQEQSIE